MSEDTVVTQPDSSYTKIESDSFLFESIIHNIFNGDLESIIKCMELNRQLLNTQDSKGWTMSHYVAYADEVNILNHLLYHSSHDPQSLFIQNTDGNHILHIAAQQNSLRVIRSVLAYFDTSSTSSTSSMKQLLEPKEVILNSVNNWSETSLHIAAANGHLEVCKILIESGSRRDMRDKWYRTPYIVAKENGCKQEVLDCLIYENQENPNLINIINNLSTDTHQSECSDGKSTTRGHDTHTMTLLQGQITNEFMTKIALRKSSNSPVSLDHQIINVKHIFHNEYDSLQQTSASSTQSENQSENQSDSQRQLPFQPQSQSQRSNIIEIKRTAISKLVEYPGDVEGLRNMISDTKNYDPAGKDMFGLTALHKFAVWNKSDLVDLLLPVLSKDEVNMIHTINGYTALHYCVDEAMVCERVLVQLLQDPKVDKTIKDKKGRTAWDLAIEKGQLSVVEQYFDLKI